MGEPRIIYVARADTTQAAELDALTNVYRFILDCHAKKKAAHPGGPDDAKKESKHVRARNIIPK